MAELSVRSLYERALLPVLMFIMYALVLLQAGMQLLYLLAFLFIFIILAFVAQSIILIDKRLEEGFKGINDTLKRGFKLEEGGPDPEEGEMVKTSGSGALLGMMAGGLIGLPAAQLAL